MSHLTVYVPSLWLKANKFIHEYYIVVRESVPGFTKANFSVEISQSIENYLLSAVFRTFCISNSFGLTLDSTRIQYILLMHFSGCIVKSVSRKNILVITLGI